MPVNSGQRWKFWNLLLPLRRDECLVLREFELIERGRALQTGGNFEDAERLFQEARVWYARAQTLDARRVQAEALVCLGDLYLDPRSKHGKTPEGHYREALTLYQALSHHNFGAVAQRLAIWCEMHGQVAEASHHYQLALETWKALMKEQGRRGNPRRYREYQQQIQQLETQLAALMSNAAALTQPKTSLSIPPIPAAPPIIDSQPEEIEVSDKKYKPTTILLFPRYTAIAAGVGELRPGLEAVQGEFEISEMAIGGESYLLTDSGPGFTFEFMVTVSASFTLGFIRAAT